MSGISVILFTNSNSETATLTQNCAGNLTFYVRCCAGSTYTAREWEPEVGLYYYRARFYDASLGRFISEDPIGFDGKDKHLYRYALNSPTNFTDPTGKDPFDPDATRTPTNIPTAPRSIEDFCGSKGTEWVPELGYGGKSGPCANHDKCYGDCNGPSKEECDRRFLEEMMWTDPYNRNSPNSLTATIYHSFVDWFGGGAFERARKDCDCEGN